MAPLRLLAALLATHLQFCFGQQNNEGNNLIAVASHKLAAIKQQSQKQNVTDTDQATDSEDDLDLKSDNDLEKVNVNSSILYPVGSTITSIKFVKNPAYDGPAPSFSIINSKDARDPISVNYDSTFFNLTNTLPNDMQLNTGAGQAAIQQTKDAIGFVGKSPVFLSFTPQFSGAGPSQSPYIISALPTQFSSSNMATLQPSPASPLKQPSQQTCSPPLVQPSNVQNSANMRMRFVPVPTAAPMQSTGPAQSALAIQSTMPVHSTVTQLSAGPIQRTVPIQSTVPTHSTVGIPSTVQSQNTVPSHHTVPSQHTVPRQHTVPMQVSAPPQRTVPIQRPTPIQNSIDNIIQNPHLPVLLTHLLSENPIKQDYSAPTNIRYSSQDQQQPPKQTAAKTLLPLLLQLLTEKNNNCCEYKNKQDRSRTYNRYKHGNKQHFDQCDTDLGMLSDMLQHFRGINQNKRLKRPIDETLEEDYSNESSDYSAEEYDDED